MHHEINIFNEESEEATDDPIERYVKQIIEALLFAGSEPLSLEKIKEIVDIYHPVKPRVLRQLMAELQQEYLVQKRSFKIEEVAQGFVLVSLKEFNHYIDQLHRNRRTEKLSHAAVEVLAIIAYRQPVTRPQIEAIRGVDSSGTLQSLMERGLIEITGKLETPGRPALYGITKEFLAHFGLKDLNALPRLS